jgi:hypothetical protein
MKSLVPECWRDAIVAGRCRKSSTSFVAGGPCQPRQLGIEDRPTLLSRADEVIK